MGAYKCMTDIVCDNVAAHAKKIKVASIVMVGPSGNYETVKTGQRIVRKHYGHDYWLTSVGYIKVKQHTKNEFIVSLSDMANAYNK